MTDELFFTTTPGLKARVKHRYSDFIVEEVLTDGYVCKVQRYDKTFAERGDAPKLVVLPSEGKEHLQIEMEKINQETVAAIAMISRGLNVSRNRIGYAGLKDKRAITCQKISIFSPEPARVERFGVKGIELRNPVWSDKRIELGELKGNNFVITLRDIAEDKETIEKALADFAVQAEHGLPNYFGNQRFGGKRQITHKVGKLLLQDNFKDAVMLYLTDTYPEEKEDVKAARINFAKTLDIKAALKEFPRDDMRSELAMLNELAKRPDDYAGAFKSLPQKIQYLFVHAYQSHLFNKMLTERIRQFGASALLPIDGDIIEEGQPTGLLAGFESTFAPGKVGEIEQKVLEDEGVIFENFRVRRVSELSSKGSRKSFVLKAENFKTVSVGEDEFNPGKRYAKVSFFLSKGNYATTVIRELLKEDVF